MLFNLIRPLARRVIIPGVVSPSLSTRFISTTPAFDAPTKRTSRTTPKASKPKTKTTRKVGRPPLHKKKKEEEKPKFDRGDLKVPARPVASSYICYIKSVLGDGKHQGTAIAGMQLLVKGAAAKWKTLTEEEKRPFAEQAEEEAEKARKEYEKWAADLSPAAYREINKKRKAAGKLKLRISDKTGPKSPLSPWARFVLDVKAETPGMTLKEAIPLAQPRWRELSEERKKVYFDARAAELEEYRKQKDQWKAQYKM